MKRLAILLALITVALALPATGALAKKGHKGSTYDVTMNFVNGQGLATTCNDGTDKIEMTGSGGNVLSAYGVFLEMMVPIDWWRDYDAGWGAPTLDDPKDPPKPFTGCHGLSQSAIKTDSFPGALWLTFGKDTSGQDTVTFLWRFDYYWQFGPERTRGKKTIPGAQEVLEVFELTSDELLWEDDGTVNGNGNGNGNGQFSVTLFTKTADDGVIHFWKPMGTADLTFNLTITRTG